jgi:hypothetical protein
MSKGEVALHWQSRRPVARSGQTKEKLDAVGLAPAYQSVASKPRIGARHNAYLGPPGADLGDKCAVSSTAPAAASISARRSFANRCGPLKMYSGK